MRARRLGLVPACALSFLACLALGLGGSRNVLRVGFLYVAAKMRRSNIVTRVTSARRYWDLMINAEAVAVRVPDMQINVLAANSALKLVTLANFKKINSRIVFAARLFCAIAVQYIVILQTLYDVRIALLRLCCLRAFT